MYYIGIDLGGTNIAAGITDTEGNILYKGSLPTGASRGRDAIIGDIATLCRMLCRDAKIAFDEIGRIGIAVPGGVDAASGEILFTPNIPLSGINMLRESFGEARRASLCCSPTTQTPRRLPRRAWARHAGQRMP